MTLGRVSEASPDFSTTAGCEILCSRVYSLKRAFKDVNSISDWKQLRGASANKWKSKVRWDLASELDWRPIMDGEESLPGVEKDLTARLQQTALFQKYLHKAGAKGAKEEDD